MNVSDQRLAVARLTTYCEIIITRGLLPTDKETALRALVNSTCSAFDMASVVEREVATVRPRMGNNEDTLLNARSSHYKRKISTAASIRDNTSEASAPAIEVTPAMMEAGVEEFCSFDAELERPAEVVMQIFLRMERLRGARADHSL